MKFVRGEDPGLAVLQDGRVLVAGGTTVPDSPADALASAELYTRSTDTVASAPGTMSSPRMQNAAVTLLDGKVLVIGGAGWSTTSRHARHHRGSLRSDERHLRADRAPAHDRARRHPRRPRVRRSRRRHLRRGTATADLYDPATDTFTQVPMLRSTTGASSCACATGA